MPAIAIRRLAATMLAISATVVVAALQITDDGGEGCVARFDPTLPKRYPHEVRLGRCLVCCCFIFLPGSTAHPINPTTPFCGQVEYNFPVLDADGNEETFETRTVRLALCV